MLETFLTTSSEVLAAGRSAGPLQRGWMPAGAALMAALVCGLAAPADAQAAPDEAQAAGSAGLEAIRSAQTLDDLRHGGEWCSTEWSWRDRVGAQRATAMETCPTQGQCDDPVVRDGWIPDPDAPMVSLAIKFNVFANDDGSSPAASEADIAVALRLLNEQFAPSRVQFVGAKEVIPNSRFRTMSSSEEDDMKMAYADDPEHQLNIFVTTVTAGYLGKGTFPWDADALTSLGGVVIDGASVGAGLSVLAHEVGHNLGLWHTHHGVSEVDACSGCYESPGAPDNDYRGDFCSDTDPTPVSWSCSGPGGSDTCSGSPWGATDPQNYMSYAPSECQSEFSPQQMGRIHCWTEAMLTSWSTVPRGGCCTGDSCDEMTEDACHAAGGRYLGDGASCTTLGDEEAAYSAAPGLAIPDDGGPSNGVSSDIEVDAGFDVARVEVQLAIEHTWVGDLVVVLEHAGAQVWLVQRPGSGGCDGDDYDVTLADDGDAGNINGLCKTRLVSPPTYSPAQSLAAFNGLPAAGTWTLKVWDDGGQDLGTLLSWGLTLRAAGPSPCGMECELATDCQDGDTCTVDSCGPDGLCAFVEDDTDPDGDGVPMCRDECPDDPDKSAPGDCGCGFPDDDTDEDGLADCIDVEECDGLDNDGDGATDEGFDEDADGDGFPACREDCDDADPLVNPGSPELEDGQDQDCDGRVDEGTAIYDDDGDGLSESDGDCDDSYPFTYPGADELLDARDNDCDGLVDEGTAAFDDDGDGFSEYDGDCDDADPNTYPGAEEVNDGIDNDCDGVIDLPNPGPGCQDSRSPLPTLLLIPLVAFRMRRRRARAEG